MGTKRFSMKPAGTAGPRLGAEAVSAACATGVAAGADACGSAQPHDADGAGTAQGADTPRPTGGRVGPASPTASALAASRGSRPSGASGAARNAGPAEAAGGDGGPPALGDGNGPTGRGGTGREGGPGGIRPHRPLPPRCYRMSEVVEYSGVSRQTIHNYTTMGLICEVRRTKGGHRLYGEDVFARLDLIAELKRQNRTMREIRRRFRELEATA